jgi:hypothetical protein
MHARERGAERLARWLGLGLVTEIALPISSPGTVDE